MGSEYSCQTLESEEETVNKIFKDMFKREFQSGEIYSNFLRCIIINPTSKKIKLSRKLFIALLEYVLEDNQYKGICINYILNFVNEKSEIDSIRKIGLLLIDLNTNKDITRKKIYLKHFKNFYLNINNDSNVNNNGLHKGKKYF